MAAGDLALRILITASDAGTGAAFAGIGSSLKNIIGLAALAATAAVIAFGVESVKAAADFQQGLQRLVTGAGDTTDNMQQMGQAILGVSVATGVAANGADGLNAAMYLIISSNQKGAQAISTLTAAAQGAQIEMASVGDVTGILTTLQTDFGIKTYTATQYMNGLIKAVSLSKLSLEDMSVAMSPILPIAHSMGISFIDVAAAMDVQTNAGLNARQSATGLQAVFVALEKPTKAAASSMKSMGVNSVAVANEMKKSLPGAIQMLIDAALKVGPVGSVAFNRAMMDMIGGGTRTAKTITALTQNMKEWESDALQIAAAMKLNANAVQGWDMAQQGFNIQMDIARQAVTALMITIGSALLPVLTRLLSSVTPLILAFTTWVQSGHAVSDTFGLMGKYAQIVLPIVAALAAIILMALVPAVWALAAGIIAATWPFLLVGAAVAAAVAIFIHFYQTSAPFRAFVNGLVAGFQQVWSVIQANFIPVMQKIGSVIMTQVWPVLQQIGSWLLSVFKPVWQQLVQVWQQQLLPAFQQLMAALAPAIPFFKLLAIMIGGLLLGALGLLIGIIAGVVKAFAGLISGLAVAFGGVVKIVTGAISIIGGIIGFFVDLCTGKFDKLGADLQHIWQGIISVIGGAWDVISGLFEAAWGVISGFVSGLVEGIIGFFQHLWSALVGHSIIPDMINGILQWFANLVTRGVAFVESLVNQIVGFFLNLGVRVLSAVTTFVTGIITLLIALRTNFIATVLSLISQAVSAFAQLPGRALAAISGLRGMLLGFLNSLIGAALNAGAAIVNGIANGIRGAIGNVAGAIGSVTSFIAAHLPHSPAKLGALRDLDTYGPALVKGIAAGIVKSVPTLESAMNQLLKPVSTGIAHASTGNAFSLQSASTSGGYPQSFNLTITLDGRKLTDAVGVRIAKEVRVQAGVKR